FTSNHDENSWNKADYATMPGESHAPFAVLTQTLKNSVPLIYSGQEEPVLDSISFFYKDAIEFGKYQRAGFYQKLLNLRSSNAALAANASFTKLITSADDAIYAFVREKNGKKVLVVTNLSKVPQTVTINNALISGEATNIFTAKKDNLKASHTFNMNAWGYLVYDYTK
ncbi:MAG: alpha-glucosidase C-terminal domain-containing protein, partial [Deinococcales bacterium]|nr:alpha-glucosidase C-terminal domain-containing protein [Chitinophagaceae bacterium]